MSTSNTELLGERLGPKRLEHDVLLGPYTTFQIGGPADVLYRATTPEEMVCAVRAARELEVPFFLRGMGANILIGDHGGLHQFVGIPSIVGGATWQNLHFLSPVPLRSTA